MTKTNGEEEDYGATGFSFSSISLRLLFIITYSDTKIRLLPAFQPLGYRRNLVGIRGGGEFQILGFEI
jgi:hypothetical protein